MSTSNQQRASGRRQAFGDLHENTIPSAKSIAASTTAKAADSKKKIRASTSSSLTRSHSKKNDRSSDQQQRSGSSSSEEDHVVHKMVGSPTKKNRVMMMDEEEVEVEDSKPAATPPASNSMLNDDEPQTEECAKKLSQESSTSLFDTRDVADIFRPRPALSQDSTDFWADEMEDMLELKRANPILDESVECLEDAEKFSCPSEQVEKELDDADDQNDAASGMLLDSPNRLHEDTEVGIKIHTDVE